MFRVNGTLHISVGKSAMFSSDKAILYNYNQTINVSDILYHTVYYQTSPQIHCVQIHCLFKVVSYVQGSDSVKMDIEVLFIFDKKIYVTFQLVHNKGLLDINIQTCMNDHQI